ncbi:MULTISPECIES: FHA domain-containing protein [unclassified Moraxella]|uniref:FHA domain-containing protein n=1 Tax=unclassified Moraxella TaxID=2685852 RepID=UPI003AF7DFEE
MTTTTSENQTLANQPVQPLWQLVALTPQLGELQVAIGKNLSLGRSDTNDIVLALPQISRQHAKINRVGNNLYIQDLGSANGTFINEQRIGSEAVQLENNDEVALADMVFKITQSEPHPTVMDEPTDELIDKSIDKPIDKPSTTTVYSPTQTSTQHAHTFDEHSTLATLVDTQTPEDKQQTYQQTHPDVQPTIEPTVNPTAKPIAEAQTQPLTKQTQSPTETNHKKTMTLVIALIVIFALIVLASLFMGK